MLPEKINVNDASLPASYEAAKQALAECSSLDECKDWSDKAGALASYAKQADDDTLEKYAMRIRARAIRRCGELLKTFDGRGNNQHADGAVPMHQAATNAGLSERQAKTAVRVASVDEGQFEIAVEDGVTITKLAGMGKKTINPYPDAPPAPKGFAQATQAIGVIKEFASFTKTNDPIEIANGVMHYECAELRSDVAAIDAWLDRFIVNIKEPTQ